ncbi:MAG: hypothetical protein DWQ47_12690 [Acidobacteria bacterium]|nr:MAG: hypothetical protein DWQ32_00090 [Acidobacteriota bacterium]REK03057.1 MAG: hypothetical protein DWQ38_12045 [Acidobacteriota bacterium]REK13139.1 MAG: hypothetical protein DWQ43_05780 [Acidobacteriota bacterium]REK41133.1 MAG: hypothetical protein DWQ47_12690 [Acidobacteriota bacterium]
MELIYHARVAGSIPELRQRANSSHLEVRTLNFEQAWNLELENWNCSAVAFLPILKLDSLNLEL